MSEIDLLRSALQAIKSAEGTNTTTLGYLTQIAPKKLNLEGAEVLRALHRILADLRVSVMQRAEIGPLRTIALQTLDSLDAFFEPKHLITPVERRRQSADLIDGIIANLVSLESFVVDDDDVTLQIERILEEMHAVVDRCDASTQISVQEKSIISNNFDLLKYALSRVQVDGMSSFKKTAYTAAGQMTLEMSSSSISERAKKFVAELTDLTLKVAGLAEVTGSVAGLLTYTGGVPKLLPAPGSQ